MEKVPEKAIRLIRFLSNNASVTKNERVKNPKTKRLRNVTLQNVLFVKDSLTNEGMTNAHKIFQQSTTTLYENTR